MALVVANSAFQGVHAIGYPEARIILSEAALYIACAPKSNSAYKAIDMALKYVEQVSDGDVPWHLRSTPTRGFVGAGGSGREYIYPHDHPEAFVDQPYMEQYVNFYRPNERGHEAKFQSRLRRLWKDREY